MRNAENCEEIRQRIRNARRGVSEQTRARWSAKICRRVTGLDLFQEAKRIAGFLAFDGEADPLELMKLAVERGQQIFVPIIVGKSKPLLFAPWNPNIAMKPNRFGILEPDVAKSEWIAADELDFVITPLVAFDESCNRIGVGGGFYDRSFCFMNESKSPIRVHLIGFAFELQKVHAIKAQPWDVPLAGVITESARYDRPSS